KKRPPERLRSQGGGEPEPFPGAIGLLGMRIPTALNTDPNTWFRHKLRILGNSIFIPDGGTLNTHRFMGQE
ncbi:MAG: hypothetical protein MUQ67_06100, partial [Pirellulales bacterium]|nr:hypothetical protein [Pirellulales bacterium]